jgi:hypothetical protein
LIAAAVAVTVAAGGAGVSVEAGVAAVGVSAGAVVPVAVAGNGVGAAAVAEAWGGTGVALGEVFALAHAVKNTTVLSVISRLDRIGLKPRCGSAFSPHQLRKWYQTTAGLAGAWHGLKRACNTVAVVVLTRILNGDPSGGLLSASRPCLLTIS